MLSTGSGRMTVAPESLDAIVATIPGTIGGTRYRLLILGPSMIQQSPGQEEVHRAAAQDLWRLGLSSLY